MFPSVLLVGAHPHSSSSQVLQAGTAQAKTLNKAAYFFSVSPEDRVVHLNFIPKADLSKTFNAKTWIAAVSAIVGGKGGGKDDGAQGVGSEVARVDEAIKEAEKVYNERQ